MLFSVLHLHKEIFISQRKIHTGPYVTVLAQTGLVHITTKFNFMDTLNRYPFPVFQMLNVNWSDFLEGILPNLQSHDLKNDTNGEHQLGGGDIRLLPLPLWSTNVAWAIV